MSILKQALWFIERDLATTSLERLAVDCDQSPSHLTRMFALGLGLSLMRYVRARRMTEAAKALVYDNPSILNVALDTGYGSHEAFTRAFSDHFGKTPEAVRAARTLDNLTLTEPMIMPNTMITPPTPRFETLDAFSVTGLFTRYAMPNLSGIPAQWQALRQELAEVVKQPDMRFYGVCMQALDSNEMDYGACVPSSFVPNLPKDFRRFEFGASSYAVFEHRGHVSSIGQLWMTIYSNWNPDWGKGSGAIPPFERYDARFDSKTGTGLVEIWLPVVR